MLCGIIQRGNVMQNPQYSMRWDEKAQVWVIYSHRFNQFTQVINAADALPVAINMDNMIDGAMKERGR